MSIELSKIPIANINAIYNSPQKFAFRGTTTPLPNDTVEFSKEKQGTSLGAKISIGLGTIGIIGLTIGLLARKKRNK